MDQKLRTERRKLADLKAAEYNPRKALTPDDAEYQENIHFYFPDHYDRKDGAAAFLNLLKGGRLTAGEIAGQFDMTAATVSYHLSQLKKAGLIFESREKNYIYYSLNASVLEEVLLWLQDLKGEGKK